MCPLKISVALAKIASLSPGVLSDTSNVLDVLCELPGLHLAQKRLAIRLLRSFDRPIDRRSKAGLMPAELHPVVPIPSELFKAVPSQISQSVSVLLCNGVKLPTQRS